MLKTKTGVEKDVAVLTHCYHCGTPCIPAGIHLDEKIFCCEGCKLVYEVINSNGLCDYYKIQSHPGLSQIKPARNNKYAWLDDQAIAQQLYKYSDSRHAIVTLQVPGVHCSSCMWLLEHMHKLDPGITESRLNFSAKEVTIHFLPQQITLRKIVELLTTLGYEPAIHPDDPGNTKQPAVNKAKIYKLGVAGFCFGNIMMMSFPEYLSGSVQIGRQYETLFRMLNLALSLPVFFYAASEFFSTAWAGLKQKTLNIDAPIALAILITFGRSLYEILTHTGSGYLDSMSGIVFFMLVGRVVQERTYKSLSFHRDYKAYFPIAVNVVTEKGIEARQIAALKEKDVIQIYNDEVIPADSILVKGKACIDYSFVTGEAEPVNVPTGAKVYAGGRQTGEQLVIQILTPVAGSYLTSLWNHYAFRKDKAREGANESIIHSLSRYFTIILFCLAGVTTVYWSVHDPAKILPAVSAMLIVACPCALLLSATYTNGNVLRILSNNGLYLRDASVIEQMGKIDEIVFDKTGTLTEGGTHVNITGHELSEYEKDLVVSIARSSSHPQSKALVKLLGARSIITIDSWKEVKGAGIEASTGDHQVRIGSARFTQAAADATNQANVYVNINGRLTGYQFLPALRSSARPVIQALQKSYGLSVISGDNDRQRPMLETVFGDGNRLFFEQKPLDKLTYIESLQANKKHVAMVGDGLNDAGALQQSTVGITLADDINNFTPSCDAILDASRFHYLPALFKLAKSARVIIFLSFGISILYNIIGLAFSMQGSMRPMIAAILMPVSTLSIVLITTGAGSLYAKTLGLSLSANK